MRSPAILLVSGVCLALALTPAEANVIRKLDGKFGVIHVRNACSSAGGSFHGGAGGDYACVKANCDGKGGDCAVDCKSDGTCTGSTPERTKPGVSVTPSSILLNSHGGQNPKRREPPPPPPTRPL